MTNNRKKNRLAQIAIIILFLALVRSMSEYFRLKYVHGSGLEPAMFEPFLKGAIFTAVCTLLAVILYFFNRMTAVTVIAALTIICLLIYKLLFLGA
jgi:hypothetical protein